MDFYIFSSMATLSAILVLFALDASLTRLLLYLLTFLATYRIFDCVSYRWHYIFHKCSWKPWRDPRRSLAIAMANLSEIVIAYAILYLRSGLLNGQEAHLSRGLNATYFSFVTITTLGYGDYARLNGLTRFLVATEVICGLTFLAFIIPALVSLMAEPSEEPPTVKLEKEIRERAFTLYERRARTDGDPLQDWLEAEDDIFRSRHPWIYEPTTQLTKAWKRGRRKPKP